MLNKIVILFLSLVSLTAYAQEDQFILDGGLGVFDSAKNSLSETKMVSLGLQEDVWYAFKDRFTLGTWLDNAGNGRSGSFFGAAQVGFEVENNGTVASIFTGPGLISTPDTYLGGYFQFMTDLHLGMQDKDFNYIGIMYRHMSSAGIETPNIGRDFMGLELRFPISW